MSATTQQGWKPVSACQPGDRVVAWIPYGTDTAEPLSPPRRIAQMAPTGCPQECGFSMHRMEGEPTLYDVIWDDDSGWTHVHEAELWQVGTGG